MTIAIVHGTATMKACGLWSVMAIENVCMCDSRGRMNIISTAPGQ